VSEISYGEQRLVEIAMALSLKPRVLLLDEPAAGIPTIEMSTVIDAIHRLPADTAVLLIEHDMTIVRELATEVSVLVDGRIIESGTPRDILSSPKVKAVYLGAKDRRRARH
jgi:branched-chain amino acid transport system ATP-binding protein